MIKNHQSNRRQFLKTSAALGGGLLISFYLPAFGRRAKMGMSESTDFMPNAFVRIGADDIVTVIVSYCEMGQGVYTAIPMIVAEELDADWSKVRFESAPVDPAYNHPIFGSQVTGASTSITAEWDRLRKAGATGRAVLIAAAAQTWGVEPATCRTENGKVIHDASGRSLRYGELSEKASGIKAPQDVKLKDPTDFKLVGKAIKRLDTPQKTNGTGIFGLDVQVPGMLVAVIARPPVLGGKVKSFNADKTKSIQGVKHVVEIDRGVAVVADGFWAAKLGRDALEATWDDGPLAGFSSKAQRKAYAALAKKPGLVARKEGDTAISKNKAVKKIAAVYELPYLAHAMMEPLNCVADVKESSCEIWTGTQLQTADFYAAVKITGLKPEQVKLHTTLLGGGFGRRSVFDSHFVVEAVQISKAIKNPVKVIWTREDDIRGGYYRPAADHTISGGIDGSGNPVFWQQTIVTQSIMAGTPVEKMLFKDGVDETSVEGSADLPYDIPHLLIDWQQAPAEVPVQIWRSVGYSHNSFVSETFIDELAGVAGKDPYQFRRALLSKHPRHKRVLEMAAEKSGWGKPLPAGHARGIAVAYVFGSYVAHVAEVSIPKNGKVTIHHVTCVIDCGPVVNPDTVKAQMEGGAVFGISAALYGEITFENGKVQQGNFHDYPVLRMNEMPVIDVHIVPSTDKMGGVGEIGVPTIGPAIANALFVLTGKRIHKLPFQQSDLKKKV